MAADIFYSNLLYWDGKQWDPEGWIYKTQAAIEEETGLTRGMQERARKKLRQRQLLEERPAGHDPNDGLGHRINWEALAEACHRHFPRPAKASGTRHGRRPLAQRGRSPDHARL